LLIRAIGDYFLVLLFFVVEITISGIRAFWVRQEIYFGWNKSLWRLSIVSAGGKDLIFPI